MRKIYPAVKHIKTLILLFSFLSLALFGNGVFAANKYATAISIAPTATQTRCQGVAANQLTATITIGNNGNPGDIKIEWFQNTVNNNTGGTVVQSLSTNTNTTTSTYTPSTSTAGTFYYYCKVTNVGGSGAGVGPFSTATVQVTVNAPPAITGQPSPITQTLCANTPSTPLSVTATGTALTYQWYSNTTNSNVGGTSISGQTSATYTPPTTTPGTLYYYVIVSGTCTPAVTSNPSTITVVSPPASIAYGSNPAVYCAGVAVTNNPSFTGGAPTSYSVSPALPAGLSLNTSTGVISGTPTTATASAGYAITASNSCGFASVTVNITISPAAPSALNYTSNTAAYCVGIPITDNSPSNAGGAPTVYTVSPALPSGLSLDPLTGVISGTPTTLSAAADYTVTASNSCGSSNRAVNITVTSTLISVSYSSNPAVYCAGAAITPNTPATVGGTAASYSVNPALPTGLTLNTTSGVISGMPSAATAAADYTVTATNSCASVSVAVNITISPAAPSALTYTSTPVSYCIGVAIPNNAPSNSGGAPTSYSVNPALPAGLSLNISTGIISGTPNTVTASANYTITTSNSCGSTNGIVNIGIITAPASLTYSTNPAVYCPGSAITSNTPSSSGGTVTSYSVSPALPAGLSLSTTTGVISGTPTTASAAANYTVTATNSCGSTNVAINITISPAAPTALTYSSNTASYCMGIAITSNTPSNGSGASTLYSVNPALPSGLTLNTSTGVISGTPTAASAATNYTVTASNLCGSTTKVLNFTVYAPPTSNAGTPLVNCKDAGQRIDAFPINITSGSSAANYATVTWSKGSGTGTLTNPNSLTAATYDPSAADISSPTGVTFTLTVTGNGSCGTVFSTKTLTFTNAINEASANNWIQTPTCSNQGVEFVLQSSPTGGNGTYSYQWNSRNSCGSGAFFPITGAINPNYIPTTNDCHWLVVTSGGCSVPKIPNGNTNRQKPDAAIAALANVTITPGATAICIGGGTTLTASSAVPYTYSWTSNPAGFTSTSANPNVSPTVTTQYTVVGTATSGPACSRTSSVTITVNPLATLNGVSTTTVCSGTNATITLNGLLANSTSTVNYKIGSGATQIVPGVVASGTTATFPIAVTYPNNGQVLTITSISSSIGGGPSCAQTFTTNNTTTLSVNDNVAITVQPVSTTYCVGGNASFPITITGTGTPTYQWQISTDNITYSNISEAPYSVNASGTLTITGASLALNGKYYRVIVTPPAPCVAPQTSVGVQLLLTNTWTGITSSDWNIATNWTGNVIPDIANTCADVYIPSGTPYSAVLNSTAPGIHNITIYSGATVTFNTTLKIAGSMMNSGTFDVRNGGVELNGPSASPQTIPANVFYTNKIKDLIISNDVSLAGVDSLTGILSFSATGKTFNTNDNLTLKSTAANTAAVSVTTGNAIVGAVTVERYFGVKRAWRFLSVPTQTTQTVKQAWQEGAVSSGSNPVPGYGTQVTDHVTPTTANGFDYDSPDGPGVKKYNPSVGGTYAPYVGIATTFVPIATREGWMTFVRGDRRSIGLGATPYATILRTKGPLYTGDQPYSVTAGQFTSIGNPYAAPLDMKKISKTDVTEFFYVWDPFLTAGSSNGLGAFQTFNIGTDGNYYPTPGGGSYPAGGLPFNYIESGLAFFVHGNPLPAANGTVAITENSKATSETAGSTLVFRPASGHAAQAQLRTNLYAIESDKSASLVDGALAQFVDKYSNAVDMFDALKLRNVSENLAIKTDSQLLVVERRQTIAENDTIHLNMQKMKAKSYRFEFIGQDFDPLVTAFIEDSYTNTRTPVNINGKSTYDFTVENIPGSYNQHRFRIVFKSVAAGPLPINAVKASQQNKNIAVEWKVDNEKNIKQYEVEKSADEQHFTMVTTVTAKLNNSNSTNYQWLDVNAFTGNNYYRIKSISKNGETQYSNIVKVEMSKGKSHMMVYPNPVTNGNINLQLINQAKGKYALRLMNKAGQLIMNKQIEREEGSSTETLKIKLLAHGIYQLEVTKPDNSKTNINVLY